MFLVILASGVRNVLVHTELKMPWFLFLKPPNLFRNTDNIQKTQYVFIFGT